jgi:hypothetical protein
MANTERTADSRILFNEKTGRFSVFLKVEVVHLCLVH